MLNYQYIIDMLVFLTTKQCFVKILSTNSIEV